MEILVASNNLEKVKEIKEILKETKLITLNDIKSIVIVTENGETFEENARVKAKEIYEQTKIPCLADDSGICIKKLEGWPGVRTARFLGEEKAGNAYARERNEAILQKMKDVPKQERMVDYITVMAYYDGKEYIMGKGVVQGYIAEECRGKEGFGFDEIFELENGRTLAELTKEEKNQVSSRKKALEEIKKGYNRQKKKEIYRKIGEKY